MRQSVRRSDLLTSISPSRALVEHEAALHFVSAQRLMGKGLGWIDVHVLASAKLDGLSFWSLDERLAAAANSLGLAP